MSHPAGLGRLTLAARDEPIPPTVRPISNSVATAPELRCDSMVHDIANHVSPLPILDQPKSIATELEIISPLIDTVGSVALDVDASLDIGE